MKIEHILVISDQQDKKQKALAHGKAMAERSGAKLHVVAFHYEHLTGLAEDLSETQINEVKEKSLQLHQQWLDEQVAKQEFESPVTSEVVWEKDIAAWVQQHCKTASYDLILKTGHRSEGANYVPTDWHLIRNGQVPVLLVADKKWRKKQCIMVALDMGTVVKSKQTLNQKLVDAGRELSASTQMPLHFSVSIPFSPALKDMGFTDTKKSVKKAKQKYLPLIQAMLNDDNWSQDNLHIKAGQPSKVLPSIAADIAAGLVIIGTVGRKGLKAKLLGNTAEEVLSLLKTDVLAIQP
jgi:universal stress protein E